MPRLVVDGTTKCRRHASAVRGPCTAAAHPSPWARSSPPVELAPPPPHRPLELGTSSLDAARWLSSLVVAGQPHHRSLWAPTAASRCRSQTGQSPPPHSAAGRGGMCIATERRSFFSRPPPSGCNLGRSSPGGCATPMRWGVGRPRPLRADWLCRHRLRGCSWPTAAWGSSHHSPWEVSLAHRLPQ